MTFDSKLETKGGKPSLKQKSVAKLLELKEYDLCDIWRIRNPTKNYKSGIINRRLETIYSYRISFKNFLMALTLFQLLKLIIHLF